MNDCYGHFYANVHRGIHTLSEESTERYERVRTKVARFISAARENEVIFTSGTTAGINLVARSWGDQNLAEGDVVLTTIMEHHANIVPWQQLAERTGCRIEFAPLSADGQLCIETFDRMLDELRPKLVAVTACSNVLGTITPIHEIVHKSHHCGAIVLVDAAQAVPHTAINVADWDADFTVFSGHKVCGPTAIGVLHGKESLLESMPPFLGGGAMIHNVTTTGFQPAALPEKFEAGTPPIAEVIGLGEAIEYVESIGLNAISQHERALATLAHERLGKIEGVRILGPAPEFKAGIVSFVVEGAHPHDISQVLDRDGIAIRAGHHCAMPLHERLGISASSRASFYFYNTTSEVEQFTDAVAKARKLFRRK